MRYPKQQFFLLLAVSLSLSFWQTKAFSLDITDGLNVIGAGSRGAAVQSDDVKLLCQKGSSILDMEEAKINNASDRTDNGISEDSATPNLPSHGQGISPASDSSGVTLSREIPESSEPSETPAAPERINRSAAQPVEQGSDSHSSRGSNRPEDAAPVENGGPDPWTEVQPEVRNINDYTKNAKKSSKKKLSSKKSKAKKALGKEETEMPAVAPSRVSQPPEVAKPPVVKMASEEAMLERLVKELEFGTLLNSITLLNQLVAKYPEDPDYNSLLAMAIRLRDGDVWYQYARKVDIKEDKTPKASAPVQIMKPSANETVNELKKSSWFLIRSAKR